VTLAFSKSVGLQSNVEGVVDHIHVPAGLSTIPVGQTQIQLEPSPHSQGTAVGVVGLLLVQTQQYNEQPSHVTAG
jgi:hypothetical protein